MAVNNQESKHTATGRMQPPLTHGPDRLHYQMSVVVPQIYLTFVTLLQGIALGALVFSTPPPQSVNLSAFIGALIAQHFYLAYAASVIVVLLVWQQLANAALFALWPMSMQQTALLLLAAYAEIISFRALPSSIAGWVAGLGVLAIIGGIIRLNNLRITDPDSFESAKLYTDTNSHQVRDGILFILIGVAWFAVGMAYNDASRRIDAFMPRHFDLLGWVIPGSVTVFMILLSVLYLRGSRELLVKALMGSGLRLSRNGQVLYESKGGAERGASSSVSRQPATSSPLTTAQESQNNDIPG